MEPHLARHRLLIDNDWAGDPDGLAALAHHALSPTNDIVAVTSSFLSPIFIDPTGTAARGAAMAEELLAFLDAEVTDGASSGADSPHDGTRRETAAALRIVREARRVDDPLLLVCGGPLTNVADALVLDPTIATKLAVIWVGGSADPNEPEYNRDTDAAAYAAVLACDDLTVRQFPLEVYRTIALTTAELEERLTASGSVGAWLWNAYATLPLPPGVVPDPVWPLGDSAPIALTTLGPRAAAYEQTALNRWTCTNLEGRLIIEDFFARLRLHRRR